jgi:hypothetical protein
MLAAPAAVAELLVRGMTEVSYRRGEGESSRVRIENRGPVPLTVQLQGHGLEPVQIGAYQSALLDLATAPDKLAIEWVNVVVRSDASLVTQHAPLP